MNNYFFRIICCGLLLVPCLGTAQQAPRSNVFLFGIEQITDSVFRFTEPQYLTFFNRDGYNNQPHFMSDNQLYITVQRPYEERPDIYSLHLGKEQKIQITATPEGEYSPELMPSGRTWSAVRMEKDAANSQRLWEFPLDRKSNGRPVFKYITNVGYYEWLNRNEVAMFLVTDDGSKLVIGDVRSDQTTDVANNVGRSLQKRTGNELLYVQKATDLTWYLKSLNLSNRKSKILIETLPGSEDFAVLPDGSVIMGKGSKLYKYHPSYDKSWVEVNDLRFYNISKITRLAASRDGKLAIVGE